MADLQHTIAQRFRQFLPNESVLTSTEERQPYECDGLSVYRRLPMVVVLPETVQQVQQILQTAHLWTYFKMASSPAEAVTLLA